MKRLFFTIAFYTVFLYSCAQITKIKGYAFYRESIPGRELPKINGKELPAPHDTLLLVYLQAKTGDTLIINNIVYNGDSVSAAAYQQPPNELIIGVKKGDGKQVALPLDVGKTWWRVEIGTGEKKATGKGTILIKGKHGKQSFQLKLTQQTELEPLVVG